MPPVNYSDKKTEEDHKKKEELNQTDEKLRMVVELLIKEGFIKKEKLQSTETFIKKYAKASPPQHKNVSN